MPLPQIYSLGLAHWPTIFLEQLSDIHQSLSLELSDLYSSVVRECHGICGLLQFCNLCETARVIVQFSFATKLRTLFWFVRRHHRLEKGFDLVLFFARASSLERITATDNLKEI
jgi:hypothetical protein